MRCTTTEATTVGYRITAALLVILAAAGCGKGANDSQPEDLSPETGNGSAVDTRVDGLTVLTLVTGLDTPWDLAWGPDGQIWVSERKGTISRVDAKTGAVTEVGQIEAFELSESGLMGIAFHPDFENRPFVYAVYSYNAGGGSESPGTDAIRRHSARPARNPIERHSRSAQSRRIQACGRT